MRPGVGEEGGVGAVRSRVFFRASGFVKSRVLQPDRVPGGDAVGSGASGRARAGPPPRAGGRAAIAGARVGRGGGRGVARAVARIAVGGARTGADGGDRDDGARAEDRERGVEPALRGGRIAARRGRRVEQRGAFAVAAELGGRSHRRGGAPAVVARSAVRAMTRRPKCRAGRDARRPSWTINNERGYDRTPRSYAERRARELTFSG